MVRVRVATAARCQLLLCVVSFGTHYLFAMTLRGVGREEDEGRELLATAASDAG